MNTHHEGQGDVDIGVNHVDTLIIYKAEWWSSQSPPLPVVGILFTFKNSNFVYQSYRTWKSEFYFELICITFVKYQSK